MPRNYVDNAMNRSLGRVGMPVGSMPHSRSSGSSSFGSSSSAGISYSSSSGATRTYVDNAYNRQHGRVGAEVGTHVISAKPSTSETSQSSSGTTKTYVDNAYNRQHGRVGAEVGTHVISAKTSTSETSQSGSGTTKTYVDNAYNRQHGRVGAEVGTRVISAKTSTSETSQSGSGTKKTYVDNAYNRQHGRVGAEVGTRVISKTPGNNKAADDREPKTYKDNPYNRRLGRVGKIIGTHVVQKGDAKNEVKLEVYTDSPANRKYDRVGKPRGSLPIPKKSKTTTETKSILDEILDILADASDNRGPCIDEIICDFGIDNKSAADHATNAYNRLLEEMSWMDAQELPRTTPEVLKEYTGSIIPYGDLEVGRKIGQGGFGEVYFARWQGTPIAVKKLLVERLSKRRVKEFAAEIEKYSKLDHPNIVKFFGACIEMPDLAIVMEYMDMSLFDAIHIRNDIELSEPDILLIIQGTVSGLEYLHKIDIAHCDLKTANVLMHYKDMEAESVKLTDFGLSVVRNNTETSVSNASEMVQNRGTPRYSAPEVLRGEMLNVDDMKKTDIYSLSLIMFELFFEEEPFYDLAYAQLQRQVGEKGLQPEFPDKPQIEGDILNLMKKCLSFEPGQRPVIERVKKAFSDRTTIYDEAE